jgi:hypothetical protein
MGRDFIVRTDHRNLTWESTLNKDPQVQRWINDLQRFRFRREYVKGEDNPYADAMSRVNPPDVPSSSLSAVAATTSDVVFVSSTNLTDVVLALLTLPSPICSDNASDGKRDGGQFACVASRAPREAAPAPEPRRSPRLVTFSTAPPVVKHSPVPTAPAHHPQAAVRVTAPTVAPAMLSSEFVPAILGAQDAVLSSVIAGWRKAPKNYALLNRDDLDIWHARGKDNVWRAIIPEGTTGEQLRGLLLHAAHDDHSHNGSERLRHRLLDAHVTWSNMQRDAVEYCAACPPCQRFKGPSGPARQGEMLIREPATRIMQRVHVDLAGQFPTAKDNDAKYILVVVEAVTRWVTLIPLRDAKASSVFQALQQGFFGYFGTVNEIIHDNGSHFEGTFSANFAGDFENEFLILCENKRIKFHATTAYNQQSNGLVERAIQTVKNMLKTRVNQFFQQWPYHLGPIMLDINTAINRATGVAPADAMLSFSPHSPLKQLTSALAAPTPAVLSAQKHALDFRRGASVIISKMISKSKESAAAAKAYYDSQRNTEVEFIPNVDYVFVYHPNKDGSHIVLSSDGSGDTVRHSNVLVSDWRGPWPVISRISAVIYECEDPRTQRRHTVHVQRMRKVDTTRLPTDADIFWANIKSGQMHLVSGVLAHRFVDGELQLLCTWLGWDMLFPKWLPYLDCKVERVHAYMRTHSLPIPH